MRELVLELMGEYGNLAVFLLILVENLFPPIPSEVILTFGGVMTVCTDMTPVGVILFSTAGSLAGAVILYSVGRFLPDEVFRKLLCGQIGHLLHFRLEDVDLAKGWFRERGRSAVFLCRLIPIVRSLHDGNRKNLIVLTQPKSYRKTLTSGSKFAAHALRRKYPAMTETMLARPGLYNDTVCLCRRLAEENPADTVLLQPDAPLATFEKDIKKLEWGYEMGYNMTCDRIDDIKSLFV